MTVVGALLILAFALWVIPAALALAGPPQDDDWRRR